MKRKEIIVNDNIVACGVCKCKDFDSRHQRDGT